MKLLSNRTISELKNLLKRYHWLGAIALAGVFFGLSFGAMRGDSAIVDELAHVPAAYSYVHYGDYRLNPEHPPLLKDLAGIPLQFLRLNFPSDSSNWNSDHPEQYSVGYDFLYRYGNDAKQILFWARLPLLLFATAFGLIFYWILRRRFGISVGLLALFFYALSPNFLAHSHYVTTDVGASIGMFIGLVAFIHFLEQPSRNSIIWLSLALAFAQLTKFSSVLLYPFILLVWLALFVFYRSRNPWILLRGLVISFVVSFVWIYLFYVPNTIALSAVSQSNLFEYGLGIHPKLYDGAGPMIANFFLPLTHIGVLRPLLQYILGMVMVISRVASGNVSYFNGAVSLKGFHGYFPEIFVLKTQVALLVLMTVLPLYTLRRFVKHRTHSIKSYLRHHRFEVILLSFVGFYSINAVTGNLNIGIRHILPIYPPLFALVAIGCIRIIRSAQASRLWVSLALGVILVWYAMSAIFIYPFYTAYFNGLLGGPAEANKYFSDSGIDWGQDLDRLKTYTDLHPEITSLALDYFGGSMPPYVFCKHIEDSNHQQLRGDAGIDCSKSIYHEWHAGYGQYKGQYIAVSETYLMNDLYYSGMDYTGSYDYLRSREPIAKIGYSIYLYKLF